MQKSIDLSWEELWPLANILNEVCNGIYINDFEKKIGATNEEASLLHDKIISYEVEESELNLKKIININKNEVEILRKSLKEVSRQIEEWEFQTRIGVTLEEVEATLKLF